MNELFIMKSTNDAMDLKFKVIIQHFRKSTVFHYNNVELDMR